MGLVPVALGTSSLGDGFPAPAALGSLSMVPTHSLAVLTRILSGVIGALLLSWPQWDGTDRAQSRLARSRASLSVV